MNPIHYCQWQVNRFSLYIVEENVSINREKNSSTSTSSKTLDWPYSKLFRMTWTAGSQSSSWPTETWHNPTEMILSYKLIVTTFPIILLGTFPTFTGLCTALIWCDYENDNFWLRFFASYLAYSTVRIGLLYKLSALEIY